jgi:hypothetical protein
MSFGSRLHIIAKSSLRKYLQKNTTPSKSYNDSTLWSHLDSLFFLSAILGGIGRLDELQMGIH